jgi:hypothetical protein
MYHMGLHLRCLPHGEHFHCYCQVKSLILVESTDEYVQTSQIPAGHHQLCCLAVLPLQSQARGNSHRDIEDLLAERGITVSREAIRLWLVRDCLSNLLYETQQSVT